jgi:hypothetical protein
MLNEIMHLEDEAEARRILMKLGNGLPQVESFIEEWKAAKEVIKPKAKPVVTQKVVTETDVEKEVEAPKQVKVSTVKK